eukprot:Phypoly_transcript_00173.p1 GENE.Phypoly_transcript_00173~~Phypoly_transcript_00173.p1  ORF type:complete len:2045 (+),score=409.17 Phypoly_transcript_00173:110-6244(+)
MPDFDFTEQFALADEKERENLLRNLIPNSSDYFHYTLLHLLNTNKQDTKEFQTLWQTYKDTKEGETDWKRYLEIKKHFSGSTDEALHFLKDKFKLFYGHTKKSDDLPATFPSKLQGDISAQIFNEALNTKEDYSYIFTDEAAFHLLNYDNPKLQHYVLGRISVPNHPNLPKLVAEELQANKRQFGDLNIHRTLTREQLDALLAVMPSIVDHSQFVEAYVSRIQPTAFVNLDFHPDQRRALLNEINNFSKRLAPRYNSLKALILYHILKLDKRHQKYDEDLFTEYLSIPKRLNQTKPELLKKHESDGYLADPSFSTANPTLLPSVSSYDHEQLITSFLAHFFAQMNDFKPYQLYLEDNYLKQLFVESKLLAGSDKVAHDSLNSDVIQRLRDRVDIELLDVNKTHFFPEEEVTLQCAVKNAKTLFIKIFEINTITYYEANRTNISIDIDLNGLVPSEEKVQTFDESPIKRVIRSFSFPSLNNRRGAFVIELVGNGKSSRALIQKGALNYNLKTEIDGFVYSVVDEKNSSVTGASIWADGHWYTADGNNEIILPFGLIPSHIVIAKDNFGSLHFARHSHESYTLSACIDVDRENLIRGKNALVVIKPNLTVGYNTRVSVEVLEETSLLVETHDSDGVVTTKEVQPFPLYDDKTSTWQFLVPENLRSIKFEVKGKIKPFSGQNKTVVSASRNFDVNSQDGSMETEALYLRYSKDGYKISYLGKNGEPRSNRVLSLTFKHRFLKRPHYVQLQTDEKGTVYLGHLPEITNLSVSHPTKNWDLTKFEKFSYGREITAKANERIDIPFSGALTRDEISFFEQRESYFVRDCFNTLKLQDGAIHTQLPSGIYLLRLPKRGATIEIKVLPVASQKSHEFVACETGFSYEYAEEYVRPPYVSNISTKDKQLVIKVENARPTTSVIVTPKYFVPEFDPFLLPVAESTQAQFSLPLSEYVSARQLGDEYMYILERKHAKKYPGNSLKRPSILLTPWAVQSTTTNKQTAFEPQMQPLAKMRMAAAPMAACSRFYGDEKLREMETAVIYDPVFDFLATSASTFANLRPDKDGQITVELDKVHGSNLRVIVFDKYHTSYKLFGLEDREMEKRDATLREPLNPANHYTESKRVDPVLPKSPFTLTRASSASYEIYDTLPKLFQLFTTLSENIDVSEFQFLTKWPSLSDAQKQEKYSKFACHEVNFFLFKKDNAFFNGVVKPFIACKKEKTFFDYWLLDSTENLKHFLNVKEFHELNVLEQILLGVKFPQEAASISKLIESRYESNPKNLDYFNKVFVTALKGTALDAPPAAEAYMAPMMDAAPGAGFAAGFAANSAEGGGGESFKRSFAAARRAPARIYSAPEKTKEYAETHYYHVRRNNSSGLIPFSPIWKEFAIHAEKSSNAQFLPKNISIPESFTDVICTLAIVDLPFELSQPHSFKPVGDNIEVVSSTPFVIFHKEVSAAELVQSNVVVSQNFFDPENMYSYENGERVEQYVRDEFLVGKVYGCSVAITNIGSSTQKLETLYQIPEGAIPANNGAYTKGKFEMIAQYSTLTSQYYFYFPRAGTFKHFPAHAAKDQKVLAAAAPVTLKVVDKLSKHNTSSWEYVAHRGTQEQVLEYLATRNLFQISLQSIAWQLQDKAFFEKVTTLLRKLKMFDTTLWSYALLHNDVQATKEYLLNEGSFVSDCKPFFTSPFLSIDPFTSTSFEHLEYYPLVNARVHKLGNKREILNDKFQEQYNKLLEILTRKPSLSESDRLSISYYLLLQDRVDEALKYFNQITSGDVTKHTSEFQIQYDYMAAYFDLYNENPTKAPVIAAKYINYPVPRWNNLFKDIRDKIASINDTSIIVGEAAKGGEEGIDRDREQAEHVQTEPGLSFSVESKKITINYDNIDSCSVNYYLMDVELLFSTNPFVRQDLGRFSFVAPNKTEVVELPKGKKAISINLPEAYHNSNVMIDIKAKGIRKSTPYYSHSLDVKVIHNYGQLRVLHATTHKPISKTYVKVYARMNDNSVSFYKDGYTDFAGVFDYASLSTDDLDRATTFAILVMSEEHGAVIVEAKPPAH